MNENLNLVEILKDCPEGTKLYSTVDGDVELLRVCKNEIFPIKAKRSDNTPANFAKDGKFYVGYSGECVLFPSCEQRDWSKFTAPWLKGERFDPKTLSAFDKVLVRDGSEYNWMCSFFSCIQIGKEHCKYWTVSACFEYCIPYNEDTKHLVGTNEEAPEFYRYWKE